MINEYRKQVMHNAVTHHPATPQAVVAPPANSPSFIAQHEAMGYGTSLWPIPLFVSCACSVPSQLLGYPQPPCWQESPWLCASTALQQLGHWCFISIILILNTRHSTIPATRKNIDAVPAETEQHFCLFLCKPMC